MAKYPDGPIAVRTLKTIVVLPAYNAAETLAKTIADIPFAHVDEIVLVDDASSDDTLAKAQQLQKEYAHTSTERPLVFTIEQLPKNKGYGGNQKKCYDLALDHGAGVVVMIHPDYQYDPTLIPHLVGPIIDGHFDVMLGSRIRARKEALAGGMPQYKYYANRALTTLQNLVSGQNLSEWHTGMRAYKREVLETIPYHTFSDDFVFDTQALFSIVGHGFTVGDIAVPVRYHKDSSSINFSRSVIYGLDTLIETVKFIFR